MLTRPRLLLAVLAAAATLAGALPGLPARPAAAATVYERVRVPMRDGVKLSVDIWRPDAGRAPVILTLTPYHALYYSLDPQTARPPASVEAKRFLSLGYAVAVADVRGTYNSGGCWDYGGVKERQDGYDLVEWLGTRPWSNGRVGMMGASYDGTTANAAAVERPPHLATIVPISAISRWWGYAYQQGARSAYSGESLDIDPPSDTPTDFMFGYGFLPPPDPGALTDAQQTALRWTPCDRANQTVHGYDTEPDYDQFWVDRDYLRLASRVKVPVLVAHGELDFNVKTWEGTAWFQALRVPKALVVGQWPHASPQGRFPDWPDLLERWFARWLKGERNGIERTLPLVHTQANDREWRTARSWGGRTVRRVPLGSGTRSYVDDGLLTESEMLRDVAPQRWVKLDLPVPAGTHVRGRPVLHLAATADRTSTHLVGMLVSVAPTGSKTVVSRAFLNARYKDGLTAGKDLAPGAPFTARLEFIDKDWVVPDGHRLELLVASASTTWVLSDEQRATVTLDLAKSRLDLPVL